MSHMRARAHTHTHTHTHIAEAEPAENRELADLATAFVARLARTEGRLDEAVSLIESTSRKQHITIAFEAALIQLALGEFRQARRSLARLKTKMETGEVAGPFWALPLNERWPSISVQYVEIALLSAHENVLAVGPAEWQRDDQYEHCTQCNQVGIYSTAFVLSLLHTPKSPRVLFTPVCIFVSPILRQRRGLHLPSSHSPPITACPNSGNPPTSPPPAHHPPQPRTRTTCQHINTATHTTHQCKYRNSHDT
jgi:hypothetical protein